MTVGCSMMSVRCRKCMLSSVVPRRRRMVGWRLNRSSLRQRRGVRVSKHSRAASERLHRQLHRTGRRAVSMIGMRVLMIFECRQGLSVVRVSQARVMSGWNLGLAGTCMVSVVYVHRKGILTVGERAVSMAGGYRPTRRIFPNLSLHLVLVPTAIEIDVNSLLKVTSAAWPLFTARV